MKIFHLSDHLPGFHRNCGGAEQVAYRYIKLLAASPKAEIVVGTVKPQSQPQEDFNFRRIRVMEDFFPERLHVYITGIKNRIFSFDPLSFSHLLLIFIRERPDIIHLHKTNAISLFSPILAAKILGIKIVLAMYDYWYLCPGGMLVDQKGNLCHQFHGPSCKDCDAVPDLRFILPLTSPWRRSVFNFFLKRIDGFAVLSNSQAELLVKYGLPKRKIFLIRQVFEPSRKMAPSKTSTPQKFIFFAGWLDPRKGLHVLIEAMPEIIRKVPDARLVISELSGIDTYKRKILERIKELNLKKYITFYGRLPKEEFNSLLAQAKVVVVPEQWENMSPVIIIESMAFGKAIVASRIGGIPEFIKDGQNGFLAKRNDPADFAQKIVWVLQNPDGAANLGSQAARDIMGICGKDKILNNLLKSYTNISNGQEN